MDIQQELMELIKRYERYALSENNDSKKFAKLCSSNLSSFCEGSFETYKLVIEDLKELVSPTEEVK